MSKRLNITLSGALFSLLLLSACTPSKTEQEYLTEAQQQVAQGEIESAIIALKNALKLSPKSAEIRFLLGKVYLEQGLAAFAIKELSKAQEYKYSNEKVLPLLARAYLLAENNQEVLSMSEQAQTLSADGLSQFLAYKTLAALRLAQPKVAVQSVELAIEKAPNSTFTTLAKGYLAFADGDLPQAQAAVKKVLSALSNNPEALMLKGQTELALKEPKQAIASFESYVQQQPDEYLGYIMLAMANIDAGNYQAAEKNADALLAANYQHPFALYAKALARFSAQDYEQSYEYATKAAEINKNINNQLLAGISAFYLKNYQQSYQFLNNIIDRFPAEHPARRIYAASSYYLGDVNTLTDALTQMPLKTSEDLDLLSSMSAGLMQMGYSSEAKLLNDRVSNSEQLTTEQETKSAILKVMMNDPSAFNDLQSILEKQPDMQQVELALVFAALQKGNNQQALELVTDWQKKYPDVAAGDNLAALIYLADKKFAGALKSIDIGLAKEPNNIRGLFLKTQTYLLNNKPELALKSAQENAISHPDSLLLLRQLYALDSNTDNLAKIAQAYNAHKQDINYALLYAQALVHQKSFSQTKDVLKAITTNAYTPDLYWRLLISVQRQLKEKEGMRLTLKQWLDTTSYKLSAVSFGVQLLAAENDIKGALAIIKAAQLSHPENQTLILAQVQLLLDSKDYSQAEQVFKTIDQQAVNLANYQEAQGRLFYYQNNYLAALRELRQAYKRKLSGKLARLIAAVYYKLDQPSQANNFLNQHLERFPKDVNTLNMLANSYLSSDMKQALATYEKLYQLEPDNLIINNNLAWLYSEEGKTKSALKHAEIALKLAPKQPQVIDTYGVVLLKAKQPEKAYKNLAKAFKLTKGKNVEIALNYIEALIETKRLDYARELLTELKPENKKLQRKKQQLLQAL